MPQRDMANLDFHLPTRVVFGWGAVERAGELAAPLGRRALLVTMKGLPHGERVAELLRAGGIDLDVFDGAERDPSVEGIAAAAPMAREGGFDFIVAVGGGSRERIAGVFGPAFGHDDIRRLYLDSL